MKKIVCILMVGLLSISALAGCGSKSNNENTNVTTAEATKAGADTESKSDEKITLRQLTWAVPDSNGGFDDIKQKYEAENTNVTIEIENVPTDQYTNAVKTKIFSGDAPDVMALHPVAAEYKDAAKNGYLEDLTSDPMMENILPNTMNNIKIDGKVYGVPYDQVSIVALYNKKLFADNGLKIPANYEEMLEICETLKSKGITPAAHGIKDWYVVQFFLYQIAPTTVYGKNQNWDDDLFAGKAKFNSPEWKRTLDIYVEFENKGYFTKNALGVGDQQGVQMFATGKAAMIFQGTWALAVAKQANPDIDVGAFPFPANQPGEELWMSSSLGQVMCVSKNSKNLAEAKKYLSYWTQKDIAQMWVDKRKAVSTVKDVDNSNIDPAIAELSPYYDKLNAWQFCNNGWPAGVEEVMCKKFQEQYGVGKFNVEDILNEMDKKAASGIKQ